jgi:inorganic triphosphatase YgiF
MSDQEVELKLALDSRAAAKLRRDPSVHARKAGRAGTRRLVATYFDTANCALRDAGIALRIRREGRGRVQTVKARIGAEGSQKGGLQTRLELNAPIAKAKPDLALISDAALRARVQEVIGDQALVPLFTTDIKRTAWRLDLDGAAVELVLDIGAIEGNDKSVPVREAELEMLSGSPSALLAFASDLRERVPFRLSAQSKAARGFALYRAQARAPARHSLPDLDPQMSAHEALSTLLHAAVGAMLANEADAIAGREPTGVHQMRVATRRARAALAAFQPVIAGKADRALIQQLKWLRGSLGPARDLDVFIDETLAPVIADHPDHKGLRALAKRAEKRRRKAYKQVGAALNTARYQQTLLGLEGWAFSDQLTAQAQPVTQIAQQQLQARFQGVCDRAGADPTGLSVPELHALRLDIKTLRYALEFFAGLYPASATAPFIKSAKKLQDCLGGLNDAAVAHEMLRDLAGGAKDPAKRLGRGTVRRIAAAQQEKTDAGLERLGKAWQRLQSQPRFWAGG